jgi:hypothetical protein
MPQIKANENHIFLGREARKRRRSTTGRIKFDAHLATSLRRLGGDYF